jgi:catechol 2,3-dioxygenase
MGFKVRDKATLEKLDADLQAYGVKTERIAAGDLLETGERVRFVIPSGHVAGAVRREDLRRQQPGRT